MLAEIFSQPIVAVIILLGVLVAVHEFGHYIVGILSGVGVETFSIGMGPRALGFRKNGTDYRFSWLPLGGYVKFAGSIPSEDVPERFRGKELCNAPLSKRAMIAFAGPAANVILAMVVYFVLGLNGIKHPSPTVGDVRPGSAAEQAGLMAGDKFVSIDGAAIKSWTDLRKHIGESPEKKLQVELDRNGSIVTVTLIPKLVNAKDLKGRDVPVGRAGIGYGFLPPVITVFDPQSEVVTEGGVTGNIIEKVLEDGKDLPIKSWPKFLEYLVRSYERQNTQIDFYLKPSKEGASTLMTLNSSAWYQASMKLEGLDVYTKGKHLASVVGLRSSQLTITRQGAESDASSLKQNDIVTHFKGVAVKDIYHLQDLLEDNKQPVVKLGVLRGVHPIEIDLPLKPVDVQKASGRETVYTFPGKFWGTSVYPDPIVEKYGLSGALWYGTSTAIKQCGFIAYTLWGLISGDVPLQALGGPMLIAKVAGDSVKAGWESFLNSMALISINLAVINLFPIPALDGGQLLMIGVQAVRRKPWSDLAIENFQKVGFVMILALIVLSTYNDLSRFWKSILESFKGAF